MYSFFSGMLKPTSLVAGAFRLRTVHPWPRSPPARPSNQPILTVHGDPRRIHILILREVLTVHHFINFTGNKCIRSSTVHSLETNSPIRLTINHRISRLLPASIRPITLHLIPRIVCVLPSRGPFSHYPYPFSYSISVERAV